MEKKYKTCGDCGDELKDDRNCRAGGTHSIQELAQPATPDWEKEIRKACGWEANDEEIIVIVRNLLTQSRLQYQKELVEKIHGEAYYEDRRRHVVLLSDVLEILKD